MQVMGSDFPYLVQRGAQAVGVVLHFAALADDDALGILSGPAPGAGRPRHKGPAGGNYLKTNNICKIMRCVLPILATSQLNSILSLLTSQELHVLPKGQQADSIPRTLHPT